jgi:hypothetical protein
MFFFQKVRFLQHFPPKILFFVFDFCAIFAAISSKYFPCGAFAYEIRHGEYVQHIIKKEE